MTNKASQPQQTPNYAQWGALGDLVFKGQFTPNKLSRTRAFNLQAQEVINGYPLHQFFGEKEQVATLDINLNNHFVNIAKSVNILNKMAENGIPRALVIGNKVFGIFGIKSLAESNIQTTQNGIITHVDYQINLVEVRN